MHRFLLRNPGPRPPYYEVAYALWGRDSNFDSDGDSEPADATDWTALTLILRRDERERVDIYPDEKSDVLALAIRSADREIAQRVATFLQERAGGELSELGPRG